MRDVLTLEGAPSFVIVAVEVAARFDAVMLLGATLDLQLLHYFAGSGKAFMMEVGCDFFVRN
jgi:hypothetical protein